MGGLGHIPLDSGGVRWPQQNILSWLNFNVQGGWPADCQEGWPVFLLLVS